MGIGNRDSRGKEYKTVSKLKIHRLAAHVNLQLTCPIQSCGKIFSKRQTLCRHIKGVHTERETHRCAYCEKSFAHKNDLQVHVKGVHEGKKAYCSICGKEFLRSSERNRHERQTHGHDRQSQSLLELTS